VGSRAERPLSGASECPREGALTLALDELREGAASVDSPALSCRERKRLGVELNRDLRSEPLLGQPERSPL
jgi:hypothetical protein